METGRGIAEIKFLRERTCVVWVLAAGVLGKKKKKKKKAEQRERVAEREVADFLTLFLYYCSLNLNSFHFLFMFVNNYY